MSTREAALWKANWSSREGLKIFKAILLLKNPQGPERERVSSALWLCCWRIAGDSLCTSGSGPVRDSFPYPSRLCQKHGCGYKPSQVHLPCTLIPVCPSLPPPQPSFLCSWSNASPSCGHRATSTHHFCHARLVSLGNFCAGAVSLQPCPVHTQSPVWMLSLFIIPKGDYKS